MARTRIAFLALIIPASLAFLAGCGGQESAPSIADLTTTSPGATPDPPANTATQDTRGTEDGRQGTTPSAAPPAQTAPPPTRTTSAQDDTAAAPTSTSSRPVRTVTIDTPDDSPPPTATDPPTRTTRTLAPRTSGTQATTPASPPASPPTAPVITFRPIIPPSLAALPERAGSLAGTLDLRWERMRPNAATRSVAATLRWGQLAAEERGAEWTITSSGTPVIYSAVVPGAERTRVWRLTPEAVRRINGVRTSDMPAMRAGQVLMPVGVVTTVQTPRGGSPEPR